MVGVHVSERLHAVIRGMREAMGLSSEASVARVAVGALALVLGRDEDLDALPTAEAALARELFGEMRTSPDAPGWEAPRIVTLPAQTHGSEPMGPYDPAKDRLLAVIGLVEIGRGRRTSVFVRRYGSAPARVHVERLWTKSARMDAAEALALAPMIQEAGRRTALINGDPGDDDEEPLARRGVVPVGCGSEIPH